MIRSKNKIIFLKDFDDVINSKIWKDLTYEKQTEILRILNSKIIDEARKKRYEENNKKYSNYYKLKYRLPEITINCYKLSEKWINLDNDYGLFDVLILNERPELKEEQTRHFSKELVRLFEENKPEKKGLIKKLKKELFLLNAEEKYKYAESMFEKAQVTDIKTKNDKNFIPEININDSLDLIKQTITLINDINKEWKEKEITEIKTFEISLQFVKSISKKERIDIIDRCLKDLFIKLDYNKFEVLVNNLVTAINTNSDLYKQKENEIENSNIHTLKERNVYELVNMTCVNISSLTKEYSKLQASSNEKTQTEQIEKNKPIQKLTFNDFFKKDFDKQKIEAIKNKFCNLKGKEIAILIRLLEKEEIVIIHENHKKQSRKHFVEALLGETVSMQNINAYLNPGNSNKNIKEDYTDFIEIQQKLNEIITK